MSKKELTPAEEVQAIRTKAKHFTLDKQINVWLNTGNERLNAVLGSAQFGIPYGKMAEIYGPNSHGKTMLALLIAALAQADGAEVAWVDLEQSFDKKWVEAQGLKYDKVFLFEVRILKDGDSVRLHSAQELCEEVEMWMASRFKKNPNGKMVVVVDSLAAMLTEEESNAGTTGQNMRTQMSLPNFLSKLLRKWVALASNYNAMIIFINQIRISPVAWGNPEYAPGGNATKHYCSIRAAVRRVKGGRMMQGKTMVGLRGVIKNVKNKVGGGSLEGAECGYEMLFGKRKWKFPSVKDIRKKDEKEEFDE